MQVVSDETYKGCDELCCLAGMGKKTPDTVLSVAHSGRLKKLFNVVSDENIRGEFNVGKKYCTRNNLVNKQWFLTLVKQPKNSGFGLQVTVDGSMVPNEVAFTTLESMTVTDVKQQEPNIIVWVANGRGHVGNLLFPSSWTFRADEFIRSVTALEDSVRQVTEVPLLPVNVVSQLSGSAVQITRTLQEVLKKISTTNKHVASAGKVVGTKRKAPTTTGVTPAPSRTKRKRPADDNARTEPVSTPALEEEEQEINNEDDIVEEEQEEEQEEETRNDAEPVEPENAQGIVPATGEAEDDSNDNGDEGDEREEGDDGEEGDEREEGDDGEEGDDRGPSEELSETRTKNRHDGEEGSGRHRSQVRIDLSDSDSEDENYDGGAEDEEEEEDDGEDEDEEEEAPEEPAVEEQEVEEELESSPPQRKKTKRKSTAKNNRVAEAEVIDEELGVVLPKRKLKHPVRTPKGKELKIEDLQLELKQFKNRFADMYIWGEDYIRDVSIDQMEPAPITHKYRPFHESLADTLLQVFLSQIAPNKQRLTLMPKTLVKPLKWAEVKNGGFYIINGQHSWSAATKLVRSDKVAASVKEKYKSFQCDFVWGYKLRATV